MKKILKGLMCAGLAGALAFGVVGAAGCKKDSGGRNPETDPLRLAIGPVDQKFNPLFYTSLNDGTIAGLTQVSLITTDAEGEFSLGENQPTVALDYVETYYNEAGIKIGTGNGRTDPATGLDVKYEDGYNSVDVNGSTTYEFLIKNDMKFSDGVPLTVMDVLFNLYVYLDPLYSGSNTIYSTKIKGLQAYRTNNPQASDDSTGSTMGSYRIKAQERVDRLIKWSDPSLESTEVIYDDDPDLVTVRKLYKEELTSDWNSNLASWVETYKEKYSFTEAWQAYYLLEGVVKEQTYTNQNGRDVRYEDSYGKYHTTLEPKADASINNITGEVGAMDNGGQLMLDNMAEASSEAKIDEFLTKPENAGISRENAKLELQKDYAITFIYEANSQKGAIHNVLRYNLTASTALQSFMEDEMTKDAGKLTVPNISGITVSHTADANHNGQFNGKAYAEDHDILKIEIKGVDPKAKWNFGIAVAPMHYYSGIYGGKNYVEDAMNQYRDGTVYTSEASEFGVKWKDSNFINQVLSNDTKNGVPVGAGPYKCTTYDYGNSSLISTTFYHNQMAYFERNPNFTTMGSGVENAKIKYITYKVTSDDKIVNALKTGEIDYGEPTARATTENELGGFRKIKYKTGGYGYVGINPRYVKDVTIRRAIMKAFNPGIMLDYYGDGFVDLINRPMTSTSWVWDEVYGFQGKLDDPYYEPATTAKELIDFIEEDGRWKYQGGSWYLNGQRQSLKYSFTIAGDTTDHPAYKMFLDAEELLEEAGFDIDVGKDPKALQKLVTGELAVWAAAWSSSIDPDPYQIYSTDSNASSTNNWYKDGIMQDGSGTYSYERGIAEQLNVKITQGRQSIDRYTRANIYAGDGGCLDLIMDMAVEFPTYQRYDMCVFDDSVLDRSTMTANPSYHMGLISELWKVNYVQ